MRDLNFASSQLPLLSNFDRTMSTSSKNVYSQAPGWDLEKNPFPKVERIDKSFTYQSKEKGEVKVPDPYHYLEQPPSQSKETKAFCEEQAAFTQKYIDQCKDLKEVREMLDTVVNYPRYGTPRSVGPPEDITYYYALNNGLDAQSTWYKASPAELSEAQKKGYQTPPGQIFFNENLLSTKGTVTVGNFYFSHDGKIAAYTISHSGSDWYKVYFREATKPFTQAPEDADIAAEGGPDRLPDVLKNVKFSSIQWTLDNKGILYQRLASTEGQRQGTETSVAKDAEVYYHRIGTSQDEDTLIVKKDPETVSHLWGFHTTDDGKFLLVTSYKGTEQKCRVYVAPLDPKQELSLQKLKWISIAPKFDYYLSYLHNDGNDFYFNTNKDASNWKIVRARINPASAKECEHLGDLKEEAELEDVVKEDKQAAIDDVTVVASDKLLISYIKDVKNELYQFELKTGNRVKRLLPDLLGTISAVSARAEDDHAFVSVMSFTTPGLVYRLDWPKDQKDSKATPAVVEHRATKVKGIDLNAFETKQIFVKSDDGASVPVYLTYLKGTKFDGTAPAWVYFYGGFAHSLMPTFSPRLLSWIGSYGGILLFVNARGGSEYGELWHNQGNFANKQNVFNDVIATAKHIVDEKIAAKGKIIVNGGSNGGLGAMVVGNQAPEGLLGCVLADVGVLDMLRFKHFTAGPFWTKEYGDCDESPEAFDYIYKYSPLHNIDTSKTYPFVLLSTADHDDRVSPLHSFKQIAELQYRLPNNPQPLLLRVTMDAGHGASNSLTKVLEEATIKYCLVAHVLGLKRKPLPGSIPSSKQ